MSRATKLTTVVALACLAAVPATRSARADEPAPPLPPGVRGEIVMSLQDAEHKLADLAAATPESLYSWRPGAGVRSTGEVFVHVVMANYNIPAMIGVKPPEGIDRATYEKSLTKKADIEKALKDSFAHVKGALLAASDADLDKPAQLFGGMKSTARGAYLIVLSHAHEHLGQSIAYARMNKITPPWTTRMKARGDAAKKGPPPRTSAAP
jgi:uncharacterized damage-inducible protein DinB